VKLEWGPDGTVNDVDVATGKPLPTQARTPGGVDLTGTGHVLAFDAAVLQVVPKGLVGNNTSVGAGLSAAIGLPVFGVRNPTAPDSDGKVGVLPFTTAGSVKVAMGEAFIPGTSATALGKAIDTTLGATDTGVLALGVRDDALATLTEADGDVTLPRFDSTGALWVTLATMAQVIGSVAHGSADTKPPVKVGGFGSAALRTAVDEGDRVDASFDLQGQLRVLPTLAAGSALIGDVGLQPRTSGGLTTFRSIDLDETEEEVKATAGQVYGYYFKNLHATDARFLKFYDNTAAGTTVGTTVPVLTIPMDAGEAGHIAIPQGLAFGTGICVAATTGLADADTGAPGASEVEAAVWFT
jgi:hypothetical protein